MTSATESERAAVRRELFDRLSADYPDVPVSAVLSAVAEADRALWLCGAGEVERATLERACRHNLDAVAAAITAGPADAAEPGGGHPAARRTVDEVSGEAGAD